MNPQVSHFRRGALRAAFIAGALLASGPAFSAAMGGPPMPGAVPGAVVSVRGVTTTFTVTYLDSDGAVASLQAPDSALKNPWGIVASATSPWWVADNGTGLSTIYNGAGVKQDLVVTVPGDPTGIVFNGGSEFVVGGEESGPARFLFASEDGTISAWSRDANPTAALVVIDSSAEGAVYKGLAIAETETGARLYATDFHNGRVDVFDGAFHPVTVPGGFRDSKIPAGFAPFGIRNIEGRIFVTYAKQDAARHDDVAGAGVGFVDVFDLEGIYLARVASHGLLNSPWGLARAPNDWGAYSGDLLVGNFGDGRITAYSMSDDMKRFTPRGELRDPQHKPITISGLWGISFGNGGAAGPATSLYFAAGTNHEADGAFGSVTVATP